MISLRHTPTLFKPHNAVKTAHMLTEESEILKDGWTYSAKHDPKGTGDSLIEVHDEDNEFIGYL